MKLWDDAGTPNLVMNKDSFAVVSPGNSVTFGDQDMLVVPQTGFPWYYYGYSVVDLADFTNVTWGDYYFQWVP